MRMLVGDREVELDLSEWTYYRSGGRDYITRGGACVDVTGFVDNFVTARRDGSGDTRILVEEIKR